MPKNRVNGLLIYDISDGLNALSGAKDVPVSKVLDFFRRAHEAIVADIVAGGSAREVQEDAPPRSACCARGADERADRRRQGLAAEQRASSIDTALRGRFCFWSPAHRAAHFWHTSHNKCQLLSLAVLTEWR